MQLWVLVQNSWLTGYAPIKRYNFLVLTHSFGYVIIISEGMIHSEILLFDKVTKL